MRTLLVAAIAVLPTLSGAHAQQGNAAPTMGGMSMQAMAPQPNDSPSTKGYKTSMMHMMEGMSSAKYTGDPDVDFMTQMRAHHQGAIDMAKVALADGKDPKVKKLAQDIIKAQEKEIAMIDDWLSRRGK